MEQINVVTLEHSKNGKVIISNKTIKDELKEFYKIIDCDVIDIVVRKINGISYNIICDDEGLLKENTLPTLASKDGNEILFGNLIITPLNDEDESELGSFNQTTLNTFINDFMEVQAYTF